MRFILRIITDPLAEYRLDQLAVFHRLYINGNDILLRTGLIFNFPVTAHLLNHRAVFRFCLADLTDFHRFVIHKLCLLRAKWQFCFQPELQFLFFCRYRVLWFIAI